MAQNIRQCGGFHPSILLNRPWSLWMTLRELMMAWRLVKFRLLDHSINSRPLSVALASAALSAALVTRGGSFFQCPLWVE